MSKPDDKAAHAADKHAEKAAAAEKVAHDERAAANEPAKPDKVSGRPSHDPDQARAGETHTAFEPTDRSRKLSDAQLQDPRPHMAGLKPPKDHEPFDSSNPKHTNALARTDRDEPAVSHEAPPPPDAKAPDLKHAHPAVKALYDARQKLSDLMADPTADPAEIHKLHYEVAEHEAKVDDATGAKAGSGKNRVTHTHEKDG